MLTNCSAEAQPQRHGSIPVSGPGRSSMALRYCLLAPSNSFLVSFSFSPVGDSPQWFPPIHSCHNALGVASP